MSLFEAIVMYFLFSAGLALGVAIGWRWGRAFEKYQGESRE